MADVEAGESLGAASLAIDPVAVRTSIGDECWPVGAARAIGLLSSAAAVNVEAPAARAAPLLEHGAT